MKVIDKIKGKFENVLKEQVETGYQLYTELVGNKAINFEEYLVIYKEILKERKEANK